MLSRIIRGTRSIRNFSLNPLVALDRTLKYFGEIHPAIPKLAQKQNLLKRFDTRKPREIFQTGLKPLGTNTDHLKHLIEQRGGFVSTTVSEAAMLKFASGSGYAYLIVDPKQQGISAKETLDKALRSGLLRKLTSGHEEITSLYSESEISYKEISPDQILMARRIIGIPILAQSGVPGSVIYVGKPEFNYNSAYLQEYIKNLEGSASSIDYLRLIRFTAGVGTLIIIGNIFAKQDNDDVDLGYEEQQVVSKAPHGTKDILYELVKKSGNKTLIGVFTASELAKEIKKEAGTAANEDSLPKKEKGTYIRFLQSAAKNMPLFLTAYSRSERDDVMDIDTSSRSVERPKR